MPDTLTSLSATRNRVQNVAVLLPCYNEEKTVGKVVSDFRAALPGATVYVYDNASTDHTGRAAKEAGAVVRTENRRGKGNVVQRMFADIEADFYVLADGDDTYDAGAASDLVQLMVHEHLDFLNCARVPESSSAFRPGHKLGNVVLTRLVQSLFGGNVGDMLSGYKILSRRFVKSFPIMSSGFEIESELTVHALELHVAMREMPARYRERIAGSVSKLRTYTDGFRILFLILRLLKDERPLLVFGIAGCLAMGVGLLLGIPVVVHFLETGLVPRLPTALASVGLEIVGVLLVLAGTILQTVTMTRKEIRRLMYLSIPLTHLTE
jgi:glycosyltransferase involved in cell wall biosynthesis